MSRKIKRSNIPTYLPTYQTIATGLLLDRFHAPGWVWGVVSTVFAILWLAVIIDMCTEVEVDVVGRSGGHP